ncbi:Surfeit locus protein 1 [Rhizophlyctis rosea]|nr:Surfeit locus protein 1 [Rhizophlyctis rosea]
MLVGLRTRNDRPQEGGAIFGSGAEAGYYVFTPFKKADDGTIVIVNRGWIPREKRDANLRKEGQVEGVVEIEGLLRNGEEGSSMMPANKPEKNEWYWIDLETMTKHANAKPVLVEMCEDSTINAKYTGEAFPSTRKAFINFRNNHLQYAITWYGISAASAFMIMRSRQRGGKGMFKIKRSF